MKALGPTLRGMLLGALLVIAGAAGAQVYYMFAPGGALSGTWNSQTVNLSAGSYIIGTLPLANFDETGPLGDVLTAQGSGEPPQWGTPTSGCGSVQTFTATLTGFSTEPTGTVDYQICDANVAYVWVPSNILATSNADTLTLTGLPSALQPVTAKYEIFGEAESNSLGVPAEAALSSSGTVKMGVYLSSGTDAVTEGAYLQQWATSGTKGLQAGVMWVYNLN